MLGIAVGTMALLTVLTFFNGLETLIISLYDTFNPDLKIEKVEGKTFEFNSSVKKALAQVHIQTYSLTLSETAMLNYEGKHYYATAKGVDNAFETVSTIKKAIIRGKYVLEKDSISHAVIGLGIENALNINIADEFNSIQLYLPNRTAGVGSLNFASAFSLANLYPSATFSIQSDFDNKYIILPLHTLQYLLKYNAETVSAVEIKVNKLQDVISIQNELQKELGLAYTIKNRFEQEETFFKIMKAEKWAVFAILTLILVIAAFNMIGSLSMLVMEKQRDIKILQAMGANQAFIQAIFMRVGLYICALGFFAGSVFSLLLYTAQKYGKLLKLSGNGGFVVEAYPVELRITDFIIVFCLVMIIGTMASYFPAKRALTNNIK